MVRVVDARLKSDVDEGGGKKISIESSSNVSTTFVPDKKQQKISLQMMDTHIMTHSECLSWKQSVYQEAMQGTNSEVELKVGALAKSSSLRERIKGKHLLLR